MGKYAVVATNPVGQETSAATLTIVPESTGEEKPLSGQPPSNTPRPVEMTPGVDFEPMDTTSLQPQETRAPRVIVPLKDHETKETMPAIFSTTIDLGSPNAKVSSHDERHNIRFEMINNVSLLLTNTTIARI